MSAADTRMPSPYITLGLAVDADEHAIKRAFRRARSAAHPDRHGGSEAAMKEVNRAYDCLSDPVRRSWYDQTGHDGPPRAAPKQIADMMLEAHARQCLSAVFAQVLDADRDSDLLRMAEQCMRDNRSKCERAANQAESRSRKLQARRERMAAAGSGPNLLHRLIDEQCSDLNEAAATSRHNIKVFDAALVLLAGYSTTEPPAMSESDVLYTAMAAATRRWSTGSRY